MSIWSEIRQRRMTQFIFAYLAGGWMVLAVIDQVVDREVLPPVVYQVGLTLYLIGIAGAVIVGWYHGEQGRQTAPLREIVMLSLVALAGISAAGLVVQRSLTEAELRDAINVDDLRRVAVLYLEDMSRDASMEAVADGITEGLISSLSAVRELDVTSRNGSREARSLGDVPPDSIARTLDVGAIIDGTVDRSGDELRVSVRLLEGSTGAALFRETFTWPADDVSSIGTELATQVAEALREQIGGELRVREARATAPNSAAWLQMARAERYLKDASEAVLAGDVDAIVTALDAAESELVSAQESAPEWAEPLVLRSRVAYEWYILLGGNRDELRETLELAVAHADAALLLDPDNPAALEWRGTALYRRWLMRFDEGAAADNVLSRAQADLERSRVLDSGRASAASTLSHLYYQVDDWVGAVIAAREAYEEDAFLDVADGVLWRLYTASYDLGNHAEAETWCERGGSRFPRDFRFVQCQIFTMTMPDATPDPRRAWALHEEIVPLLTERPEYFEAQSRTIIAGVLGLAGLRDSADVIFAAARLGPELDPDRELLGLESAMRSVMGDVDGSITAMERFMVTNPNQAPGEHWWWRNVDGNPAFERLRSLH